MKGIKKVFAIVLVAMMTVTFCACATQASEVVSQETVKEVQEALNEAGFDCGTPDGIAGNNTKNAISEYQKANGLTVTGEIDDELLGALLPPEEPEETEAQAEVVKPAEETTESTAKAEKPAEDKKAEAADGEAQYGMTEGDAFYFTFDDGVLYRMILDTENERITYDKMIDKDTVEKWIQNRKIHINMANYIVEKYFYAAIAKEEGLPTREIEKANMEEWGYRDETNPEFFKWEDYPCQLIFVRNDITWVMYYEDETVKVGKLEGENKTEVLSFDYEEAKDETENFVNLSFISARCMDMEEDSEFYFRVYFG